MEKSADLAYSAAPLIARAPEIMNPPSIFQNILIWFVMGCLVGLVGYLLYKMFVKGGKKI